MNKKQFELVAILIFLTSLIYLPTKICLNDQCYMQSWFFIWEFEGRGAEQVDIIRLVIQSIVVAGILFAVWRFRFKD
jgi:hypothetical protein